MPKTTNNKRKTVGRHSAQTGMFEVIHHVQQHRLVRLLGGLLRLRAELTVLVALLLLWRTLDTRVWPDHRVWLLAGLAVALLIVLIVPYTRRYVRARVWCVLTRHRLRQAMVGCRVMTHEGRLPRLLWSRPTSVGERVWLWLRPGLCGHHLERVTDELAAACWAREVRIHVNPKRTVLVRVDVVRYDPLAGGGVKSDLTADLTDEGTEGQLIPLPDRNAVRPTQPAPLDAVPVPGNTTAQPVIDAPRPRAPPPVTAPAPSSPRLLSRRPRWARVCPERTCPTMSEPHSDGGRDQHSWSHLPRPTPFRRLLRRHRARYPIDIPTAPVTEFRLLGALSIYDPIHLGVDENGVSVAVTLMYRNLLTGGEPGSGKSSVLNVIVAHGALSPDCRLWLFDGKQVELGPWAPVAEVFVGNHITTALTRLRELQAEMDTRYAQIEAARRRKILRSDHLPVILCVIDEVAYYTATIGSKDQQEEFRVLLRDLVARGRAAGIIVVAATQRPSADIIPTSLRDLFGYRMAFRCTTDSSSDIILSQGWAGLHRSLHQPRHPRRRLAPGRGRPAHPDALRLP